MMVKIATRITAVFGAVGVSALVGKNMQSLNSDSQVELLKISGNRPNVGSPVNAANNPNHTKLPNADILDSSGKKMLSRLDVYHHARPEDCWVSYKDGVYNITSFITMHPGGSKILLAAGQAIDPFWHVFSIHNSTETLELLETYRIGTLLPINLDKTAALVPPPKGLEKLFANEPERDLSLIVKSARPCNAQASLKSLETKITPNRKFFVRNHLPVPLVTPAEFRLEISGPGIPDDFSVSLDELKALPSESIEVTLQCAGNRRAEMHAVRPVKGLLWSSGAISNAVWTGVRLSHVLRLAGYTIIPEQSGTISNVTQSSRNDDIKHVHFGGLDGYGASIPVEKALDPRADVLLVYEMNGEPLPRDHGFPLRALVPGVVAARSVKWVNKIELSPDESLAHWQQHDYKGFSPSKTLETSIYSESQSIQELPVQSAFISEKAHIENGKIAFTGYAISGGGRAINRVDVSTDGGKSWQDAVLDRQPDQVKYNRNWAWTKWSLTVPDNGQKEIDMVCKAVDASYNSQPDSFEGIYNARGVLVNAWQRLKLAVERNQ